MIFIKWQSLRFTEELMTNTSDSELEVFRIFVAKLMSLLKEIDPSYHSTKIIRDRFMTAADILPVQISHRDCILTTAQQLTNRIAIKRFRKI